MKVKGWVVVSIYNNVIWDFFYEETSAKFFLKTHKEQYPIIKFKIKPCTITIHDKAVGK